MIENVKMIHAKKRKSEFYVCGILLPLFCYGYYKNGIWLFVKGFVGISALIFPFMFLSINFLVLWLLQKYVFLTPKSRISLFNESLLLLLLTPPKMPFYLSLVLYIAVLGLHFWLSKKIEFNYQALWSCILLIPTVFTSQFLENASELSSSYSYQMLDFFFGRGVGCFGTTNLFFILLGVSFLFLKDEYYKKTICGILFAFLSIFLLMRGIYAGNMAVLLDGTLFFLASLVATSSTFTPYTKKGMYFYSFCVCVLFLILSFVCPFAFSLAFSITFCSFFLKIFDKIGMQDRKN